MKTMTKIRAKKTEVGVISENLLAIGAGLALLGAGSAQASSFNIDQFDNPPNSPTTGVQSVVVNRTVATAFSEKGPYPNTSILGGYRDLQLIRVSNTGATSSARSIATVFNGDLNWSNDARFRSQLKVTWDGFDNSANISFPPTAGLGGVDLTQGSTLDGILLGLTNDIAGLTATVNIYNSATQWSTATTTLATANPSSGATKQLFLPFSSCALTSCFAQGTGATSAANFSAVQAIQLILDGPVDMDATVKFIEAFRGVNYEGPNNPFENPNNPLYSAKLFEAEGRAGRKGPGDYEFAIGPSGATATPAPVPQTNPPQGPLTGQINNDWVNGQDVPWEITWDKTTGQGSLKIGNSVISYPCVADNSPLALNCTNTFPNLGKTFSRFGVIASARTATGLVDPNTTINLTVSTINGLPVDFINSYPNGGPGSTSIVTSATALTPTASKSEYYFTSTGPITNIAGTAKISWLPGSVDPTFNAQGLGAGSRLDIKFKAYDPPEDAVPAAAAPNAVPAADAPAAADPVPVPESSSIPAILTVSLLGAISVLKRRLVSAIILGTKNHENLFYFQRGKPSNR